MQPVIKHLPLNPPEFIDDESAIAEMDERARRALQLRRIDYVVNVALGAVLVLLGYTTFLLFNR